MSVVAGSVNWKQLSAAVAAGLLNSSCCVVQLGLNWMSFGCAGFAVLDPLRPFFLTASYGSLISSVVYGHLYQNKPIMTKDNIISTLIVTALTLSPEVVNMINMRRIPFLSSRPKNQHETLHFKIEGMKCKACANNVKNHLEQVSPNCKAVVVQSEGRAEILCQGDEPVDPKLFEKAVFETTDPPGDFVATFVRREAAGADASAKLDKLVEIHHQPEGEDDDECATGAAN